MAVSCVVSLIAAGSLSGPLAYADEPSTGDHYAIDTASIRVVKGTSLVDAALPATVTVQPEAGLPGRQQAAVVWNEAELAGISTGEVGIHQVNGQVAGSDVAARLNVIVDDPRDVENLCTEAGAVPIRTATYQQTAAHMPEATCDGDWSPTGRWSTLNSPNNTDSVTYGFATTYTVTGVTIMPSESAPASASVSYLPHGANADVPTDWITVAEGITGFVARTNDGDRKVVEFGEPVSAKGLRVSFTRASGSYYKINEIGISAQSVPTVGSADLDRLLVGDVDVDGFDAGVTEYTVEVADRDLIPEITADPVDDDALVTVEAARAPQYRGQVKLRAPSGESKVYSIAFVQSGLAQDILYEAEDLYYVSNASISQFSNNSASNGVWIRSNFDGGTGLDGKKDFIEYSFDTPDALDTTYRLLLGVQRNANQGIVQPYLNGEKVGDEIDLSKLTGADAFLELDLGEVSFTSSKASKLYLELQGRDSLSSSHNAGVDYVRLTPTGDDNPSYTPTAVSAGVSYYVSTDGDDSNDGLSPQSPWKTISKVNSAEGFGPGSKVLFRRGDVWAFGDAGFDTLAPRGSGSATDRLVIGSYGTGDVLPKFEGHGRVADVVYLNNQEHVTIEELEITNKAAGFTGVINAANGKLVGDFRGIHITGQNHASNATQSLAGLTVQRTRIHDISGVDAWISGLEDSGGLTQQVSGAPGAYYNTGWDYSKRTGGIFMETGGGVGPTVFIDVLVHDNTITNVSFGGFTIKQWSGGTLGPKWAKRLENIPAPYTLVDDGQFVPHERVTVTDNTIDQTGQYNANGIYVTSAVDVHVGGNWVKNPGVCGIELYFVHDAIVEHNEVFGSARKAGGGDSNAIDPDRQTSDIIIQYNYMHDNGDGVMSCGFAWNTTVYRYNVLKDNDEWWLRDNTWGRGFNAFYNNVLINTKAQRDGRTTMNWSNLQESGTERWEVRNNLFINTFSGITGGVFGESRPYDSNVWAGPGLNGTGTNSHVFADARPLVADLDAAVALGSGTDAHHRVRDFSSLIPSEASPLRYLAGATYSDEEFAVVFSKPTDGKDYAGTALTGPTTIGLYQVETGDVSQPATVAGVVRDTEGEPIAGAILELHSNGSKVGADATSTPDGSFAFAQVPVGSTYTIVASASGYARQSSAAFFVPASGVDDLVIELAEQPVPVDLEESFDDLAAWNVRGVAGSTVVDIVNDPDPLYQGNSVLRVQRSGSNPAVFNTSPLNQSGRFVLSTKVYRTVAPSGFDQYGIYSYDEGDFNAAAPASSANPKVTAWLTQGSIGSHHGGTAVPAQTYQANRWYTIDIDVNWDLGTYDLYVDGVEKLENRSIRTWSAGKEFDYVSIFSTDGTGVFYVDDLRVSQGGFNPRTDALVGFVETGSHLNEARFTPESWAPFAQAFSNAQALLDDTEGVPQGEVNAVERALRVALNGLVEAALPVTVEVLGRCVVGKVVPTVTAVNESEHTISVTLNSDFASKTFLSVAPGKRVSHAFTTRQTAVPAGEMELLVTAVLDGETVTARQEVSYPALGC